MANLRRSKVARNKRWHDATQMSEMLIADLPHLREPLEELRELARDVEKLEMQQEAHIAEARVLTPKIRALAKRADHLRGLVGASLRGKHGFDSPLLSVYGFNPRDFVKKDIVDRALEQEREKRAAAGEKPPAAPEE